MATTGLRFKSAGDVFTPLTVSYKNLKIGLQAYKNYLEYRLKETLDLIDNIYNEASTYDTAEESYIPFPVTRDDISYICQVNLTDLKQLVSGSLPTISARAIGYGSLFNQFELNIEDWASYVTEKITGLQGQISIFSAALKNNLEDKADLNAILTEMQLRGYSTSDYISSVLSGIGAGLSWKDILTIITDSSSMITDESGVYMFSADDFSNTNSFLLALSSIATTIGDFFSKIEFNLAKIGDFFKALWNGLTDLAVWLITMLAGDILSDYCVDNAYNVECFDIPIASVTTTINSINSNLSTIVGYCPSNGNQLYRGTVSASDNAFDNASKTILFTPNVSSLCTSIDSYLSDKDVVICPWERGHIIVTRTGNNISCYYFIGDFSLANPMVTYQIDYTGLIKVKNFNESYFNYSLSANEFKTNAQFSEWFNKVFSFGSASFNPTSAKIRNVNNFIGNGVSSPSSETAVFPCTYDISGIDGPRSVIDACSVHYYTELNSSQACRLLVNALMTVNISKGDTVFGSIRVNNTALLSDFSCENFVPYTNKIAPVFKYHAQTDAERTSEVLDTIKRVVIAAVVAGASVGIYKANKAIKKKAMYKQAEARQLWLDAVNIPDNNNNHQLRQYAINEAYKAQRKSNLLSKISGLASGQTCNNALISSINKFSDPSEVDTVAVIRSLIV